MCKHLYHYLLIKRSGLFDESYYFLNYPDVRKEDVDPLMHFIKYGWKEGRNPSKFFETSYYLEHNRDVFKKGINPLIHYLRNGGFEGRDPCPDFSSNWYLSTYEDVRKSRMNPLVHYIKYGTQENRMISAKSNKIDQTKEKITKKRERLKF